MDKENSGSKDSTGPSPVRQKSSLTLTDLPGPMLPKHHKHMQPSEPILAKTPENLAPAPSHHKAPSIHAHFRINDVVGHSRDDETRSRSGSVDDRWHSGSSTGPGSPRVASPMGYFEQTTGQTGQSVGQTGQSTSQASGQASGQVSGQSGQASAQSGQASGPDPSQALDPRLNPNDGKMHILLAATGTVSATKLRNIINKLEQIYGSKRVQIQLVLTKAAEAFVNKNEIPKHVVIWGDDDEWTMWRHRSDPVLHIELRKWADILVVAPLTANTLAKIALGLCDNLLTNVIRAWNSQYPILIAPAMLSYSYNHPATRQHIATIKHDMQWIEVLKPVEKVVGTFGEIGMGGMMDWNTIVDRVVKKLGGYPEEEEDEATVDYDDGYEEDDEDEEEDRLTRALTTEMKLD